jgi:hypothetical protein
MRPAWKRPRQGEEVNPTRSAATHAELPTPARADMDDRPCLRIGRVIAVLVTLALAGCSREVIVVNHDVGAGGAGGAGGSTPEPMCITSKPCFANDGAPCASKWQGPIDGVCHGGNCCSGGTP